ncbi:amp dependent CoA ligase [Cristinia sonorae]|uniref:Amp dependent CoA ligase n=1 Tax=Cristinia sonorae TaxID=1940300 RepID=A0A8K0UNJ1_9AGAR|nr:amp dependent CoA ligase [Cristinia sonorae]
MEFTSRMGTLPRIPDDLTIPQFLLDSHHPKRPVNTHRNPWLIDETTGRRIGLEEIRARTYAVANALSGMFKIREDDVVCIFSPNHVDYPTALWGIHRLGAIATCANPAYTASELQYQLELSNACLVFTHSLNLSIALEAARTCNIPSERVILLDSPQSAEFKQYLNVDNLVREGLSQEPNFTERRLKPGEAKTKLALLSFSSGTTGRPKAVAIAHYGLISNLLQMSVAGKVTEDYTTWEDRRYRPGDAIYAVLPFYHIYGAVVILHFYLFCGYSLVVCTRFNFTQMLKSIETYRINHLCLVPPMIVLLCKNPEVKNHDLSSVRFVMSGAAPLSSELTEQLIKVLPNASIAQAYGMTESSTTITFPRMDMKICTLGSSGMFLPGVTAKVIKEDGSLAGLEEQGELFVKAPSVALGYYKNLEATAETFNNGWLRTGDEVIISKEHEVFIVDRKKEIFKVRGYQVAPAELEGHLLNHPDVADTCVVPIPDDYSGEVPLAFVTLTAGAQARVKQNPAEANRIKAELIKFVADSKVHYKRLAGGVEFIDVIPKNPSGKLLRRFLRDKAKELKQSEAAVKAKL